MNKKLLVGFELCIDMNLNLFNNHDINMRLLNKIRNFSQENIDVRQTIYVGNDKIQILCTTETAEAPLKSRVRDEVSKALVKAVQGKYYNMFFKKKYRDIRFEINPIYFTFSDGKFFYYKYDKLCEATELNNTDLWYEYYSKFQYEVDTCYCHKCKYNTSNVS